MTNILDYLRSRSLLQDVSDAKALAQLQKDTPFYVGIDPTAASLQVGNLVTILAALHLAKWGLKPIILFGGATGAIGDPSGKTQERQLLEYAVIEANVAAQQKQISAIFSRHGVTPDYVNNIDWTKPLSTIDFLREVGKHFTVNYMMAKDVVRTRLEGEGISFTEFSYMLLQANDFLHLFRTKGCKLQVGGSDQWGNITAGLELIRRKGLGEAYALSWPLLLNSEGKKFGKSEGGAVWLDPARTSPYKFHQFWLNTNDADALRYLRMFTFVSEEELTAIEIALTSAPEKREAQRMLADSVTSLVHGAKATDDAKRSAEVLFGGSIEGLSTTQLEEIFSDVPSSTISDVETSMLSYLDLFAKTGLVKSKGEGRRLISNGGAYVNNKKVSDGEAKITECAATKTGMLVLRSGKKHYHLVRVR